MNVFTANDLQATDLLALARLDDHGPLPVVTPPPVSDGRGRQAIRLAGARHVTGQAEMIAAAPGRARQQLTSAVTGAG